MTALLLSACGTGKLVVTPHTKYSPEQLQKDYSVYRNTLEAHHPSLYWYTSRDSMDYYFKKGAEQLTDSLTEPEFRKILSFVTAKINCGHTSIRSSKGWNRYRDTSRLRIFPLSVKMWPDTMVVTANLNRKDSLLTRGTVVTKINGLSVNQIADTLFGYISTDGYNETHKYQTLSNRGFFGSLYSSLFGLSDKYTVEYLDSNDNRQSVVIPVFDPVTDTVRGPVIRRPVRNLPKPSRKERKRQRQSLVRLLQIDTVNHTAMMRLYSFGRGYGLKGFYRRSFRTLRKNDIGHLIIDVRSNGGGSVNNSTLITRYLADNPFKISDTLYAIRKKSPYQKYIQNHFWNKLFIDFFTRRGRTDGYYHFGYFERHWFKPQKRNHYDGKVYILTGGNSFSATTLFASALREQQNVILVGEETGGGAYGNSAWLIPDVTLPETGVRFRLPLFRLVINSQLPKNGKGVQPEVPALPTVNAIRENKDFKTEKALELIKKDKEKN